MTNDASDALTAEAPSMTIIHADIIRHARIRATLSNSTEYQLDQKRSPMPVARGEQVSELLN
jgi:hypothetical protein